MSTTLKIIDSTGGDANGIVGANVTFTAGQQGQSAAFGIIAMESDDVIEVPQANAFSPGTGLRGTVLMNG